MIGERLNLELKVFWLLGFSLSTLGLLFQVALFLLVPCSRKLDQKLLTQLTIARILNVVFEFLIVEASTKQAELRDTIFALYVQSDVALVCWMFVFTKNLYDKVINVFMNKTSFTVVLVTIWIVSFPVGLLCPLLLSLQLKSNSEVEYFTIYYKVYAILKFLVLTVNMYLFCRIFMLAISRTERSTGILRTCVVSFILVCISSAQVFVTDLLLLVLDSKPLVSLVFAVINSYQVIAITIIFVILVSGACEESLSKTITKKFFKESI